MERMSTLQFLQTIDEELECYSQYLCTRGFTNTRTLPHLSAKDISGNIHFIQIPQLLNNQCKVQLSILFIIAK